MTRRLKQTNEIYECSFQGFIGQAKAVARFPCTFFIGWKNNANKLIIRTTKDDLTSNEGIIQFNETLSFKTYMIFNTESQQFNHKQTYLGLFLISQRKPGQEKLVGRVRVDLGDIINENCFGQLSEENLEFSSIKDASLSFSIKLISKQKTDIPMNQLNMDQFSFLDLSMPEGTSSNEPHSQMVKVQEPVHKSAENINELESEIDKIKGEKQKLESQNQRLLEIVSRNNENLISYEEQQNNDMAAEVEILKAQIKSIETEKNDVVQELLAQIQEETKAKIELENGIGQYQASLKKLQAEFEDSQRERLQFETEILEVKYELSELKAEREELLAKIVQNQQPTPNTQNNESEQVKILKVQVDTLNQQLEQLKRQLQVSYATSSEVNNFTNIVLEKEQLLQNMRIMVKQKERLQQNNRQLQDRLLKPGESELMNEEVEKKLFSIQGEVLRLKEEIAGYQQTKQRKQIENKSLEQQISLVQEEISLKINESEDLKKEIATLSEHNAKLNQEILYLKSNLETLQQEIQGLEKSLDDQKNQAHRQLLNLQNKIKELQDTKQSTVTQHIQNAQKNAQQLMIANAAIKKLELQNKALESKYNGVIQNSKNSANQLDKQLSRLNDRCSQFITKNAKLQSEMKIIQQKYEKAVKESKNKQTGINEKKIIIDHLNKQIQEEIKKTQDLEERISRFAEKQAQMRENIFVLQEESKKIYDIVVEQENVLETQENQLNERDDQLEFIKTQNNQLSQKSLKLEQENQSLKKLVFDLKKNHAAQELQPIPQGETPQPIKVRDERIAELEQSLTQLTEQLTQKVNQHSQNISLLENQKKNLDEKAIELSNQKAQLKKQKGQLLESTRKLQFKIEELSLQIQSLTEDLNCNKGSQISELKLKKEEYQFLENRNKDLESEVEELDRKCEEQRKLIGEYEAKIRENEVKSDELQGASSIKVSRNEFENQNLKTNIASLEQANIRLTSQINALEKQLGSHVPSASKDPLNKSSLPSTLATTSKQLKALITERSTKNRAQDAIQILVNNNKMLEDSMSKIIEERGVIQENARKLSLEFQKIKANLLKSKANAQDKRQLLNNLKPCEQKVKDLIGMSQNLTEFINELEEVGDE